LGNTKNALFALPYPLFPAELIGRDVGLESEFGHTEFGNTQRSGANMAKVANEYAVYLLLSGGHREEVRFPTVQEFQKWYSNDLVPKSSSNDFITVPLKNMQGEYMVVRPESILAIRVEPIFASSVDRDY
jgi:hypothetical protein